jgi:hypothetical protein
MAKDLSPENIARIPVVEVSAPDGSTELWMAISPHDEAVPIVQRCIPVDHVARYVGVLLPNVPIKEITGRGWFYPGEAVRIAP